MEWTALLSPILILLVLSIPLLSLHLSLPFSLSLSLSPSLPPLFFFLSLSLSLPSPQVDAHKRITLARLPPILILHLKRFVFNLTGGSQKLQKHVQYGIDLEVGKGESMILEILKIMKRILLMKGGLLLLINMLYMTIHVPTCIYTCMYDR